VRYSADYLAEEKDARDARRGLWPARSWRRVTGDGATARGDALGQGIDGADQ